MLKRSWLALLATVLLMLALATPASAHSSTVTDPEGDIAATVPAYLDIVGAKVTEQVGAGLLYFKTENAAAVPAVPTGFRAWNWFMRTPDGSTPTYTLTVRYCTGPNAGCPATPRWQTIVLNVATRAVVLDSFAFAVDGSNVKAFVDPAQVGSPASFMWAAGSRDIPAGQQQTPADITAFTLFTR